MANIILNSLGNSKGGKSVAPMVETTYSALKALRNAGNLIPGQQYRITDYHCTTIQVDTQSADHQFDIIVVADSANTLNENARACLHSGDTYFSGNGADLSAWELKYSLDNDTDRYQWADSENGKGVVFFMKDEWNNECYYDFKNIMFLRKILWNEEEECWYVGEEGEDVYLFTFSAYNTDDETWHDATLCNGLAPDDGCCSCQHNMIGAYSFNYDLGEESCCIRLNNNVFINIFSVENCIYFECYNNTFGSNCYYNTSGSNCYYNTFGNYCYYNTFGDGYNYNTFGSNCYYNTFGNYYYYNTFGNSCYNNTFGGDYDYNTFGNYCSYNTFGNYVRWCTLEDGVRNVATSCSTGSSAYLQNMHILNGTQGVSSSNKLTISITANRDYCTFVGKNSSGTLKIWCPADAV